MVQGVSPFGIERSVECYLEILGGFRVPTLGRSGELGEKREEREERGEIVGMRICERGEEAGGRGRNEWLYMMLENL